MEKLVLHFYNISFALINPSRNKSMMKRIMDCRNKGLELVQSEKRLFEIISTKPWTSLEELSLSCCMTLEEFEKTVKPLVLYSQLPNLKSLIMLQQDAKKFEQAKIDFFKAYRVVDCLRTHRVCYFSKCKFILRPFQHVLYMAWYCRGEELISSYSDTSLALPVVLMDTDPIQLVLDVAAQIIIDKGEMRFAVYDETVWNLDEICSVVQEQIKPHVLKGINPFGEEFYKTILNAVYHHKYAIPGDWLTNIQLHLTENIIGENIKNYLLKCEKIIEKSGIRTD